MAGKIQRHPVILPSWLSATVITALFLLSLCIPACAQVVHENPNGLTPSSGQGLNDQVNALLAKMLGNLDDVSSALDKNNITEAREAYSRFSSSFNDFDALIRQLNISESDYQELAGQMNLTNGEVLAIIDGSDAYGRDVVLYNSSLSAGDMANASIAAAQVRDSYMNVSSSYGDLRRNVTAMESILAGRNIDTGSLDSALGSLDRHMYQMNQSYGNLSIPENASRLQLTVDTSQASAGDRVRFSCYLTDPAGSAIREANVSIYVDGKPAGYIVTDTNGEGSTGYEIPLSVSGDRVLAHAEYVPSSSLGPRVISNYVELSIRDIPASLSAGLNRSPASFGDVVQVTGRLTAGSTGMPYRQVELFANGSQLANVSTDKNGSYAYTLKIGPSMPSGASTIAAAYSHKANDILLNASSPGITLNVVPRSTALTLNATGTAIAGSPYSLYGSLMADTGVPVGGVNVSIYLDGRAAGSGMTGDGGNFNVVINLPDNSSSANHTVYASYDPGPGKSLAASSSVPLAIAVRPQGVQGDELTMALLGAAILLILAAVAFLAWRRLFTPTPEKPAAVPEAPAAIPAEAPEEPPLDVAAEATRIRSLSDKNARDAMAYAYIVSRKALSSRVRLDESMTHHELYNAAVSALPSVSQPLNDIIGIYERAVFANRPVTGTEIDVAIGSLYVLDKSLKEARK